MHGNKFANGFNESTSPVHWSSPVIVDRCSFLLFFLHVDLQGRLNGIDVRLGEQADELSDMKGRLHEAEAAQQQGVAGSQKLERQHKELQQHQRNILHHLSQVGASKTHTCTVCRHLHNTVFFTHVHVYVYTGR